MGCVYVVQGKAGIIKVGSTKNFQRRLYALKREFRKFGDEVAHWFKCDDLEKHDSAERRTLSKLRGLFEPYSGKEWFSSGSFDEAVLAANIATEEARFDRYWVAPVVTDEERAQRRLGHIARKIKEQKDRADRFAAHRAEVDARRALRLIRRAEIAARFAPTPTPENTNA